uniref:Armadillo like helical domain containing 3 n=1 Tax=Ficedula albicollis TaxID=59894 RepID=A0A803V111_FICAL
MLEYLSTSDHASFHCRGAIINHFNPKIESYAAVNHISQLSEDQVLEVVRSNYDTLTLKLQDGLDQYERYSEQHKEAAFFKELVSALALSKQQPLPEPLLMGSCIWGVAERYSIHYCLQRQGRSRIWRGTACLNRSETFLELPVWLKRNLQAA